MGATIYKQPDGLFCRYSTVIDDFTHINMTREALFAALRERHLERWEASLNEDFDRVEKTGLSAQYTIRQDGRFDTLEDKIKTIEDVHGVEYAAAAAKALGFEKVTPIYDGVPKKFFPVADLMFGARPEPPMSSGEGTVHPTTVGKLSSSRSNQQDSKWKHDSAGAVDADDIESLRLLFLSGGGGSLFSTVDQNAWEQDSAGHYYQKQNGLCVEALADGRWQAVGPQGSSVHNTVSEAQAAALGHCKGAVPERSLVGTDDAGNLRLLVPLREKQKTVGFLTSQVGSGQLHIESVPGRMISVPPGYMCDKKHVFPEGSTYSLGQSYCPSCDCWMYVYSPEGEKQFPT